MWQKISQSDERNNNKCIIMHKKMQVKIGTVGYLLYLKSNQQITCRGSGRWIMNTNSTKVRSYLQLLFLSSDWLIFCHMIYFYNPYQQYTNPFIFWFVSEQQRNCWLEWDWNLHLWIQLQNTIPIVSSVDRLVGRAVLDQCSQKCKFKSHLSHSDHDSVNTI